jgi:hypothetical protein
MVVTPNQILKPEITATIAVKTLRFWKMIAMIFLVFFLVSFIQSVYKTLALGKND